MIDILFASIVVIVVIAIVITIVLYNYNNYNSSDKLQETSEIQQSLETPSNTYTPSIPLTFDETVEKYNLKPANIINFTTGSVLNNLEYIQMGEYYLTVYGGLLKIFSKEKSIGGAGARLVTAVKLVLEPDNNLVLYDINDVKGWSSNSGGLGVPGTPATPSKLEMDADGKLLIIDSTGKTVWDPTLSKNMSGQAKWGILGYGDN